MISDQKAVLTCIGGGDIQHLHSGRLRRQVNDFVETCSSFLVGITVGFD